MHLMHACPPIEIHATALIQHLFMQDKDLITTCNTYALLGSIQVFTEISIPQLPQTDNNLPIITIP